MSVRCTVEGCPGFGKLVSPSHMGFAHGHAPPAYVPTATEAERIATAVVDSVCNLGDYTSPDDQPDLPRCTVAELHLCVMRALGQDI